MALGETLQRYFPVYCLAQLTINKVVPVTTFQWGSIKFWIFENFADQLLLTSQVYNCETSAGMKAAQGCSNVWRIVIYSCQIAKHVLF